MANPIHAPTARELKYPLITIAFLPFVWLFPISRQKNPHTQNYKEKSQTPKTSLQEETKGKNLAKGADLVIHEREGKKGEGKK